MKKLLAVALAFGIGIVSLSQEVLWVRVAGFLLFGTPQAFAGVLGLFLLGIAVGAIVGKRWSQSPSMVAITAAVLTLTGVIDVCTPWLLSAANSNSTRVRLVAGLILLTTALKAAVFPVAHQLGSEPAGPRLGRSVSRIYFCNIVGCTVGPLMMGFWLMDIADLDTLMHWSGVAVLVMASATAFAAEHRRTSLIGSASVALALMLIMIGVYDRPHAMVRALATDPPKRVVENRHGILHTSEGGEGGDVVLGGNVYDGRVNTNLINNSNGVDRAYLAAALHPAPRRILMIGLSGGSWVRLASAFDAVQTIDVVELNPGYSELTRDYPAVNSVHSDPRITIHIDDGRRWLRRNPTQRYDLLIMNTTFYWRAYSTNLLSREFMSEAKRHLAPGGILIFNATGSPDAFATAAATFSHTYRWSNTIYCAAHDFRKELPSVGGRLLSLHRLHPGVLAKPQTDEKRLMQLFAALVRRPFVDLGAERKRVGRALEIITDDNLLPEYARGTGI